MGEESVQLSGPGDQEHKEKYTKQNMHRFIFEGLGVYGKLGGVDFFMQ